jgi:hypothetical protein
VGRVLEVARARPRKKLDEVTERRARPNAAGQHRKEADRVMVKHRFKQAAHGALLANHYDADGLLVPKIAAIGSRNAAGILGRISPRRYTLDRAALVNDPFPRNYPALARLLKQTVDAPHVLLCHRGDQLSNEQLVSDTATGDRLCSLCHAVHRLDQIEGWLRHAATLFGTGTKMLRRGSHRAHYRSAASGSYRTSTVL